MTTELKDLAELSAKLHMPALSLDEMCGEAPTFDIWAASFHR